jgi:rsbT antagonist protein RsbS
MTSSSDYKVNPIVEMSSVVMYDTQGCLIVPLQQELSKEAAKNFQTSLLERVHSKSFLGVIIDLSGIKVIDTILWDIFSKTVLMVNMLGVRSVMTGLSPGVVASIIDLNVDINAITTALTIEDGLAILALSTETPNDEDVENSPDVEEQITKDSTKDFTKDSINDSI